MCKSPLALRGAIRAPTPPQVQDGEVAKQRHSELAPFERDHQDQ
jgi:hypothetical protein